MGYHSGMDVEQLKDEVRESQIGIDRLVELIAMQQRQIERMQQRIEELEKQLGRPRTKTGSGVHPVRIVNGAIHFGVLP